MSVRTRVSFNVQNDRVDEVVRALEGVDPHAIVLSAGRSNAPNDRSGISVSLTGDVREAVKEQLGMFHELDYRIDVLDIEAL
ncbi:hypothetical protein [Streptomyces sp. NPDC057838]|uniref:hypothetical protein n=1 Tax=unclassified Streptomyces TaxID=2593676 RepID=UPI003684BE52